MIGGAIGGIAGIMLVFDRSSSSPTSSSRRSPSSRYAALILGGTARIFGPILGAIAFWFLVEGADSFLGHAVDAQLPRRRPSVDPTQIGTFRFVLVGLVIMLLVIFRPQGFLGSRREVMLGDSVPRADAATGVEAGSDPRRRRSVARRFGGLVAVSVEHLEIQRNTITALIGPNGAGKTTFFNVLTGFDRADGGHWRSTASTSPAGPRTASPRRGMVRTFQLTKALAGLTVLDNMLLGASGQSGERMLVRAVPVPVARAGARGRRASAAPCSTTSGCRATSATTSPARCRAASASCSRWRAR